MTPLAPWPRRGLIVGLVLAAALLFLLSLGAGRVAVPWSAWLDANDPRWPIIFQLRLPRSILGCAVGAALGMAGAAMQGYTRNPMADPGLLGVSSMAAFGAVITLYFGQGAAEIWVTALGALIGALAGMIILMAISGAASTTVTFVLAGMILNIMATAGTSLALNLAPNPWAVSEIINWLMGALADRSLDEVRIATPLIAAGCGVFLLTGRALDALTLGETGARSLGINMTATRWLMAVGMALTCGASVAVTGAIGFVGLIVPHLLRPFLGGRPSALLVSSAIGGAVLVLAADIAVRLIPTAAEVKLGVAMAALGGPFFIGQLIVLRRKMI